MEAIKRRCRNDWIALDNKLRSQQSMDMAATTVKKPSKNSPIKRASRRRCERKQTPQNRVIATKGKSWEKTVEAASLPFKWLPLLFSFHTPLIFQDNASLMDPIAGVDIASILYYL